MPKQLPLFKAELVALLPRLQRFARLLTQSRHAADDLLQSTIERALSRRHQWQPGTRLDTWLFSILHSVWKNDLRAQSIRRGHGFVDVESVPDKMTESSGERTILLHQVFSQVSQLPEAQRKAILLVYVEGYTYQEAADILEIPAGTLMSRLARARTRLAESLEEPHLQQVKSSP